MSDMRLIDADKLISHLNDYALQESPSDVESAGDRKVSIYDWEKGYLCGTHPWPARQYMETEQQGWKEVYDIDKTIVENAAQHFDGAREFLKAIK